MKHNALLFINLFFSVLLTGCNGGDPSTENTTSSGAIQNSNNSADLFLQKINTPEALAVLQKLDRSQDIIGPDKNNNKIRDDIENYIAVLPITDVQKKSTMQIARSYQDALIIDLNDSIALKKNFDDAGSAVHCLVKAFDQEPEGSYVLLRRIKAITFDTKERTKRFIQINQLASGLSHGPGFKEICD